MSQIHQRSDAGVPSIDDGVVAAYNAHHVYLLRQAKALTDGAFDADDIVQEVWLTVLKRRPDRITRPLLRRMLKDQFIMRMRARAKVPQDLDQANAEPALTRHELGSKLGELRRAVIHLPDDEQIAILLRYFAVLHMQQVAGITRNSLSTVKRQLRNAYDMLRKRLASVLMMSRFRKVGTKNAAEPVVEDDPLRSRDRALILHRRYILRVLAAASAALPVWIVFRRTGLLADATTQPVPESVVGRNRGARPSENAKGEETVGEASLTPANGPQGSRRGTRLDLAWKELSPSPSPRSRIASAMAYDRRRGVTVLYGGIDNPFTYGDTWELRHGVWRKRQPTHSPPVLYAARCAPNPRGGIVLFGGRAGIDGFMQNTTWIWDGVDWRDVRPKVSPPARVAHAMVLDTDRNRVVLFGGWSEGAVHLQDVWEWDGASWQDLTPADMSSSPPGRHKHAMAYNPVSKHVLLFGGERPGVTFGDTWQWDGRAWHNRRPQSSPYPRSHHGMVYDSRIDAVLVIGGWHGSYYPHSHTMFDDVWIWDPQSETWFSCGERSGFVERHAHSVAFDESIGGTVAFGGADTAGQPYLGDTWVLSSQ